MQDDSIRSKDTDTTDESFDTLWESRGKVTPGGYIVWMSIPFKSLRFRHEPSQEWRMSVWRWLGRRSEGSFWPRSTTRIRGFVGQAAPVGGIEQISPGCNLQIIPHFDWRAFHAVDDRDPANPVYSNDSAEVMGGVDAKAILKNSLVLDITAKPDFSQVESDEPQVTTNQRYEVYYPEKRPFFTENANYFDVPMVVPSQHMLFTRRIADPDFGRSAYRKARQLFCRRAVRRRQVRGRIRTSLRSGRRKARIFRRIPRAGSCHSVSSGNTMRSWRILCSRQP